MNISNIKHLIILLNSILVSYFLEASYLDSEDDFQEWSNRYSSQVKHPSDVPTTSTEYDNAYTTLNNNERPLANRGEVYLGEQYKSKCTTQLYGIKDDGVSYISPKHVNYVQFNENPKLASYESYGVPQEKDSKIDKGEYSRKHPKFVEVFSLSQESLTPQPKPNRKTTYATDDVIVFDPGHGVDHAITITHNGSNSTRDVRNFTPQVLHYNRVIRNPLVSAIFNPVNTYKEIAIYPENPLLITRTFKTQSSQVPLPIGFVFVELNKGNIQQAYYFPNLINYKKLFGNEEDWKNQAQHFKIPLKIVHDIWGHENITSEDKRREAQWLSERIGYRSLSGRYEILSGNTVWPAPARNALVRTAAIKRMERAAEYDTSVENMLQVAKLFNDNNSEYDEFQGTLYIPALTEYWLSRAFEEVKRKDYPAKDIYHFIDYETKHSRQGLLMSHIVCVFEEKLKQSPDSKHIIKLLSYFEEKQNESKYKEWSERLSQLIRESKIPGSIVIRTSNISQLKLALSNTSIDSIILDHKITSDNVGEIIEGFKWRAINQELPDARKPEFIQFSDISFEAFNSIMHAFEYGIAHNGEKLFLEVCHTAIKLSDCDKREVQQYIQKHYPKTLVTILN